MKNPVCLLYLGSDGISQHSAHFLVHQSWVPDPFSELPAEPLLPEQRHSNSRTLWWSGCWLFRGKLLQITVYQLLIFTRYRTLAPCCAVGLWDFASVVLFLHLLPWEGHGALLLLAVSLSHQFTLMKWNVVLLQRTKVPWHLQSGNCCFLRMVSVGFFETRW